MFTKKLWAHSIRGIFVAILNHLVPPFLLWILKAKQTFTELYFFLLSSEFQTWCLIFGDKYRSRVFKTECWKEDNEVDINNCMARNLIILRQIVRESKYRKKVWQTGNLRVLHTRDMWSSFWMPQFIVYLDVDERTILKQIFEIQSVKMGSNLCSTE